MGVHGLNWVAVHDVLKTLIVVTCRLLHNTPHSIRCSEAQH